MREHVLFQAVVEWERFVAKLAAVKGSLVRPAVPHVRLLAHEYFVAFVAFILVLTGVFVLMVLQPVSFIEFCKVGYTN